MGTVTTMIIDPLDIPLTTPPPGVTSNFENPESRAWQVYATAGVAIPLILIFSSLRLWMKLFVQKKFKVLHEAIFVTSVLGCLFYCCAAVVVVTVAPVWGRHGWDVRQQSVSLTAIVFYYMMIVVYQAAFALMKSAIFLLYLDLFGLIRWFRLCVFAGLAVTVLFSSAIGIALGTLCSPRGASSTTYIEASMGCSSPGAMTFLIDGTGIFNIVSGLYLLALPIPVVWKLQMPKSKKFGVLTIFLTGISALTASVVGLESRYVYAKQATIDGSWYVVPAYIVAMVELAAGTMVASMPAMAGLVRNCRGRASSWMSGLTFSFRRREHIFPYCGEKDVHTGLVSLEKSRCSPPKLQGIPVPLLESYPRRDNSSSNTLVPQYFTIADFQSDNMSGMPYQVLVEVSNKG